MSDSGPGDFEFERKFFVQQMPAVHDLSRHDVHPAIRHRELAPFEVELELSRILLYVQIDSMFERGERRRP